MNAQIIQNLMRDAENSEDPDELRIIGKRLEALGQTDYAAFAFHKAHQLQQEAEKVNG